MREVWQRVWTYFDAEQLRGVQARPRLRRVIEAVAGGRREALHAAGAAKIAGCSSKTLHRYAVAALGEGLHAFLTRFRLTEAARLLASGEQKLGALARALGFLSSNGFARAFHTQFGVSPSHYSAARSSRGRRAQATPPRRRALSAG